MLFALLAIGLPVGALMLLLALGLDFAFSPIDLYKAAGELSWVASSNYLLVSIPLFVLLGEILLRAGIADRLYSAIVQWIGWLPGGLMHANIGASTAFAATSGSSVATAATISVVAKPMIARYHYSERLFYGSVAAGGTLGILIPPSINLILYGWLTNTSVPALYMAGVVPGVLLAALFSLTIVVACLVRPSLGGSKVETSWRDRIASLPSLVPPLLIFAVIIGSIYMGIATPTESAALGVLAALGLAGFYRRLNWRMLLEAVDGTIRTTGMIMLIVMTAWFLNFVLSALGIVPQINAAVQNSGLGPVELMLVIIVIYLILGCFMDPLPMMIVTVPVLAPLVVAAGYDPVWFGIIIVLLCETALITPPIGMNLFVVQGVRRRGSITDIMIGVSPFIITLLLMIGITLFFPDLALWLPNLLRG
jgi:tripartite ATP-independent transporter DctM subunit